MAVKQENTLFAYRSTPSLLHKVPSLIKLIYVFAFCIAAFSGGTPQNLTEAYSFPLLLRTGICTFLSLLTWILAGFHFSTIKNTKFVIFIAILFAIFRCYKFENETFIFPDYDGLCFAGIFSIRFFITTLTAQCVFETTSSLEIQITFETMEKIIGKIIPPFKKLKFALTLSLAINFIPQIFSTWNKISLAAKARSPQKNSPVKFIRNYYLQFTALFSCLLKQAEEKRSAAINRM